MYRKGKSEAKTGGGGSCTCIRSVTCVADANRSYSFRTEKSGSEKKVEPHTSHAIHVNTC